MPHVLIVGQTESGKTTLAKRLCREYQQHGIKTAVLDILNDPEWHADYQTADQEEFLATVKQSRSLAVFVDEGGETIGRYESELKWLATRGRHFGHNCHFISQRASDISKTVRDQCSRLFCFQVSLTDAKTLSDDWAREELRQANTLAQGEFFDCPRFGPVRRLSLFGTAPHNGTSRIDTGVPKGDTADAHAPSSDVPPSADPVPSGRGSGRKVDGGPGQTHSPETEASNSGAPTRK